MPAPSPEIEARARAVAEAAVRLAFRDRKGHGGGECSRRVLSRGDLQVIVESAVRLALEQEARS